MLDTMDRKESMSTLVYDVAGNLSRLVEAELRLAKAEVSDTIADTVKRTAVATVLVLMAVVFGQVALGALAVSGVRALEEYGNVSPAVAALAVGLLAVVLAAALLGSGLLQFRRLGRPSPHGSQTITEVTP